MRHAPGICKAYWACGGDVMSHHPDGARPLTDREASQHHTWLLVELLAAARRRDEALREFLKREESQLREALDARRKCRLASGFTV